MGRPRRADCGGCIPPSGCLQSRGGGVAAVFSASLEMLKRSFVLVMNYWSPRRAGGPAYAAAGSDWRAPCCRRHRDPPTSPGPASTPEATRTTVPVRLGVKAPRGAGRNEAGRAGGPTGSPPVAPTGLDRVRANLGHSAATPPPTLSSGDRNAGRVIGPNAKRREARRRTAPDHSMAALRPPRRIPLWRNYARGEYRDEGGAGRSRGRPRGAPGRHAQPAAGARSAARRCARPTPHSAIEDSAPPRLALSENRPCIVLLPPLPAIFLPPPLAGRHWLVGRRGPAQQTVWGVTTANDARHSVRRAWPHFGWTLVLFTMVNYKERGCNCQKQKEKHMHSMLFIQYM